MNELNLDAERKLFEVYARSADYSDVDLLRSKASPDDYHFLEAQWAWEAWQAARSLPAQASEPVAECTHWSAATRARFGFTCQQCATPAPAQGEIAKDAALSLAYGYLWHVNAAMGAPSECEVLSLTPERAAYEARKALRDLMTSEQRGKGINAARAAMSSQPGKGEA